MWRDPARLDEPLYDGLLNSELSLYCDTRHLPVGRCPHFFLADASRPLAIEIREGIPIARVMNCRAHVALSG